MYRHGIKRSDFRNTKVSLFSGFKAKKAKIIALGEFLQRITEPNEDIDKLRETTDKETKKTIKSRLDAVTIAATFNNTNDLEICDRNTDNVLAPTGLICLDFDGKDNPHLTGEDMKERLKTCTNVLYCALSAGGNGAFAIMRLLYPNMFKSHFRALQGLCLNRLGLAMDSSCSDVTRLRSLSHDPQPYINPDAEPFAIVEPETQPDEDRPRYANGNPADEIKLVGLYVDEIERRGIDIAPSREDWTQVGFALHTIGNKGKEYFERISALWSNGYTSQKDINNFWKSAHIDNSDRAITLATFFKKCHDLGIRPYQPDNENQSNPFEDIDLDDED